MNQDIFEKMVGEALEQVGRQGWDKASQNAVTLAAYGMICHKVEEKVDRLVRPAWAIASSIGIAVLWWIISSIIKGGL